MLQEKSASCVRVVPTRELFVPGHRITHFTGPCRLEPRYQPADRSYLNFGPTRKCRCLLSHFGAKAVARLFGSPGLNETACRQQRVEVAPPQWPYPTKRSATQARHSRSRTRGMWVDQVAFGRPVRAQCITQSCASNGGYYLYHPPRVRHRPAVAACYTPSPW